MTMPNWFKYSRREQRRVAEVNARRDAEKAEVDALRANYRELPEGDEKVAAFTALRDADMVYKTSHYERVVPCERWRKRTGRGYTEDRFFLVVARCAGWIGGGLVLLAAFILALVFGIRAICWHVEHAECPRKGEALGVEYKWEDYSVFGWECLANVEGRWVPIDSVHNDTGVWLRGEQGR